MLYMWLLVRIEIQDMLIEHGGSGGTVAAPLAKILFKKIIDRHEIRKNFETNKYLNI